LIEIKNIHKSFNGVQILKGISNTFEKGKLNLIIGKSGSGKSVLTKCIVGLYEVDEGQVIYDGEVFSEMSQKERKKIRRDIGMLFQAGALFDSLTVEENVMFPLKMFTDMSFEERLDRANECLEMVDIINKNKLLPSETSGGMQKRIAIARAIAMKPKYLFADEPNSGLDPQTAILVDNLLKKITYELNTTTIVITHDMNSVMEVGDNIMFIHEGEKWWSGNKRSILNTNNKILDDFVYASDFMKQLKGRLA